MYKLNVTKESAKRLAEMEEGFEPPIGGLFMSLKEKEKAIREEIEKTLKPWYEYLNSDEDDLDGSKEPKICTACLVGIIQDLMDLVDELRDDAARWRYFASSPQTAMMLGTHLDPNDSRIDWLKISNGMADNRMSESQEGEGNDE